MNTAHEIKKNKRKNLLLIFTLTHESRHSTHGCDEAKGLGEGGKTQQPAHRTIKLWIKGTVSRD